MGGWLLSVLVFVYEVGSVVSEGGSDVFFFVIELESGSIFVGKKGSFVVKFLLLDVFEYDVLVIFR